MKLRCGESPQATQQWRLVQVSLIFRWISSFPPLLVLRLRDQVFAVVCEATARSCFPFCPLTASFVPRGLIFFLLLERFNSLTFEIVHDVPRVDVTIPCSRISQQIGQKEVGVNTGGKQKTRIAAVPTVLADGSKLPHPLIFKGQPSSSNKSLPANSI